MISERLLGALNDQLNREFYASYLYLAMSAYFEDQGYSGFASWMRRQSREEYDHMMRIYRYIFNRGGNVDLRDVKAPKFKGKDTIHVVEEALIQERKVSKDINDLVELSIQEKDHATHNFLQWFVAEQVEEEATFQEIGKKLSLIGDNQAAFYMLDKEFSQQDTAAH